MSRVFSQTWLHALNGPGEDLRFDDGFSQLKNQNSAMPPDVDWMLEKSAEFLKKSADWRVCIYALHAASISGNPESILSIWELYATLICQKFDESYPETLNAKIATFEWCVKSKIVTHLKSKADRFEVQQLERMHERLLEVHQVLEQRSGEVLKWHELAEWLQERIHANQPAAEAVAPVKAEKEIQTSLEAKPYFDKFVLALVKEGDYDRAIGLARAHRWGGIKVPEHQNKKTGLFIRQPLIDRVTIALDSKNWKDVVEASEDLFMQPQGHFFISLNLACYRALLQMGHEHAAETILLYLKKLYKSYRQIFSLMYNEGQLFCDSETLVWVQAQSSECAGATESVTDPLQMLKEQDLEKMKTWIGKQTIQTKKDAFLHDFIRIKLTKSERRDLCLIPATQSLVERSFSEGLHAWEPELAHSIWNFHAGLLKEVKPTHNNTKTHWQENWDRFTSAVAGIHLPAALEIINNV